MASNQTATTRPPQSPATSYSDSSEDDGSGSSLTDEELLALLGDEYTRRVLQAVAEKKRSGREVMDAANVSKATAYRRLSRLQEAGLVDTELVIDPNGHHHEVFFAVLDRADISVCSDGVDIAVTADSDGERSTEADN
jgi:DNA-binding transcriptional ArsR family regulator